MTFRFKNMKNIILTILIMFLLCSCRSNAELSMERGEYFYNVDRLEEATLQYNKVINYYANDVNLDDKSIKILANAHHNLAVIWFKRGYQSEDITEKMSYLGIAGIEAKRSYYLHPKDLYKQTWDKIQKAIKQ